MRSHYEAMYSYVPYWRFILRKNHRLVFIKQLFILILILWNYSEKNNYPCWVRSHYAAMHSIIIPLSGIILREKKSWIFGRSHYAAMYYSYSRLWNYTEKQSSVLGSFPLCGYLYLFPFVELYWKQSPIFGRSNYAAMYVPILVSMKRSRSQWVNHRGTLSRVSHLGTVSKSHFSCHVWPVLTKRGRNRFYHF